VRAVQALGGAILLLVLAILLLVGIQSAVGHSILGPLGTSAAATWRAVRQLAPVGTLERRTRGDVAWAAVAGLGLFAASVMFMPWARSGRGLVLAGAAAAAVGVALYTAAIV
jgi:hypothetical protein